MKNVVAYCRVSTEGQAGEDKFGIESQKEQIIDYCAKNDMRIIEWFIDEGVSGASLKRPELDRLLMGEITNPPIECVVMAKADRLARDINLYYSFKSQLNRLKLELVSVSEDWSAQDKLTGLIIENFLAMAAMIERENIRIRTTGGRNLKSRQGGYSGGRAAYGYEAKEGKLVIVPQEAETVRKIFDMKSQGATYKQIVENLNADGKTNKSGTRFAISTIQVIFGNKKLYQGMYKYGKSNEWVNGLHEPILIERGLKENISDYSI